MQVGMQGQILPPGVQDGQEADLGAQVLGVGGDFQQCACDRFEQKTVYNALVG